MFEVWAHQAGPASLEHGTRGVLVSFFLSWLLWLFAPTLCVVVIACLLSVFGFKPPKTKPGQDSWFTNDRHW